MKFTPQSLYTPITKKWEYYIGLFNNHKITLEQFSKAINIGDDERADPDRWEMFRNQLLYAMTQLHPPLYIDGYTVHSLLVDDTGTLINCQLDTYGDKSDFTFLEDSFTESLGDMVDFLFTVFCILCNSESISDKHCEYLCKKTADIACKYFEYSHISSLLKIMDEYVLTPGDNNMFVEFENIPKFKKYVYDYIANRYLGTRIADNVTPDDIKDLFDI